jgi:zinc and cadmium transporter
MTDLTWILASGLLMSAISLAGAVTLLLTEVRLRTLLLPLVAFAAGSLLGGALFHLIPAAVDQSGNTLFVYLWVTAGFAGFFALEQFLNWHHGHQTTGEHQPVTYMILAADSIHNFIDGVAVAGAFLVDIRIGISACVAAAAHEIPQELGDFAVLVHGGWKPSKALLMNFLSGLTFLMGGLAAHATSRIFDVSFLLPFAAGNFIYIAAADLIPEIKQNRHFLKNALHFGSFAAGLALLLAVRYFFEE